jgi:hypothetical protein
MTMMLKCKRQEASFVTVAADNAEFLERTIGCLRMQGRVHFSKALRSTEGLERLMEEDASADRPFIAALAISKARGGLPGPGFRLGRFASDPFGQDARAFHTAELNAVIAYWDGSGDN